MLSGTQANFDQAHGCYAMTATTALTAQDTTKVYDIHVTPPDFLRKQIDACIDDVGVDAVKLGMLASEPSVQVVAEALKSRQIPIIVLDPVMVSTSGSQLLPEDAVQSLRENLIPLCTISTPNLPEAQLLLRNAGIVTKEPESVDDVKQLAQQVQSLGSKHVLLKGGHLPLTKDDKISKSEADHHTVLNVLCGEGKTILMKSRYVNSTNTHGTGCSLASAIASNLASGMSVERAVWQANAYVEAGIKNSVSFGKGNGPINHFHSIYTLPFPPGGFIDYLLQRDDVQSPWKAHTEHDFIKQLADGSLDVGRFKNYLIQDYLFLVHFARANALSAYKSKSLADIRKSAEQVTHLMTEMEMHIKYCEEFGLTREEIEAHEEHQACTAYTRYVLDVGQKEDWFGLQVVLLPCMIGYGQIARRLYDDPSTKREGNSYFNWIEQYVGADYEEAMRSGRAMVEEHATKQSASRIDELARIFIHATKMETGFWEMGLGAAA